MLYRVRYYYLATGMEGIADERDMGVVEAVSPEHACDIVAAKEATAELRRWVRYCLSASPVTDDAPCEGCGRLCKSIELDPDGFCENCQ